MVGSSQAALQLLVLCCVQGVLGSKAAKQPADEATVDAIRNLAQKLPPAERSSLNSLLASALKNGDTSGAYSCCTSSLAHLRSTMITIY